MPTLTLDQEALLHVIKEKRSKQDLEGLTNAMDRFYKITGNQSQDNATNAVEALNEVMGIKPQPAPAPRPEPVLNREQELLKKLLKAETDEERNRVSELLTENTMKHALNIGLYSADEEEKLTESINSLEEAIINEDEEAFAAARNRMQEDLTAVVNKNLGNQKNWIGMTKLGPTTAVVLAGQLHGELGGSLGDRQSNLTSSAQVTRLHGTISQAYDAYLKDKYADKEINEDTIQAVREWDKRQQYSVPTPKPGAEKSANKEEESQDATKDSRYRSPTPLSTQNKPRDD